MNSTKTIDVEHFKTNVMVACGISDNITPDEYFALVRFNFEKIANARKRYFVLGGEASDLYIDSEDNGFDALLRHISENGLEFGVTEYNEAVDNLDDLLNELGCWNSHAEVTEEEFMKLRSYL